MQISPIENPNFHELVYKGFFGENSGQAHQLYSQGYCLFSPKSREWDSYVDLRSNCGLKEIYDENTFDNLVKSDLNSEFNRFLKKIYPNIEYVFKDREFIKFDGQKKINEFIGSTDLSRLNLSLFIVLDDFVGNESNFFFYPSSHNFTIDNSLFNTEINKKVTKKLLRNNLHIYLSKHIEKNRIKITTLSAKKGDLLIIDKRLIYFANPNENEERKIFKIELFRKGNIESINNKLRFSFKNLEKINFPVNKVYLKINEYYKNANSNLDFSSKEYNLNIEKPLFENENSSELISSGYFGSYKKHALSFKKNGFFKIRIRDGNWIKLIDSVRNDFKKCIDENPPITDISKPIRFQDAWKTHNFNNVLKVACHSEILVALKVLFGRNPFPFQTLNFINGSRQHFHSDAIHFSSLPQGFMCGVWVAMEDVKSKSGPLEYYPGSHNLPYLFARDLDLFSKDVKKEKHPQKFFEANWRKIVKEKNYINYKKVFLAKKGEVLVWHANLLHGGSPVLDKKLTRYSQVTHYYFRGCEYTTPLLQTKDNFKYKDGFREPLDLLRFYKKI